MAGINSPGLFWEQLNLILVGQLLPPPPPPPLVIMVKTDLPKGGMPIFNISFHTLFKGAQAWDIRERFFYTNQMLMGRWLGDWRKKLKFRKLESLFQGFRREFLIKRTISMRLKITLTLSVR